MKKSINRELIIATLYEYESKLMGGCKFSCGQNDEEADVEPVLGKLADEILKVLGADYDETNRP